MKSTEPFGRFKVQCSKFKKRPAVTLSSLSASFSAWSKARSGCETLSTWQFAVATFQSCEAGQHRASAMRLATSDCPSRPLGVYEDDFQINARSRKSMYRT